VGGAVVRALLASPGRLAPADGVPLRLVGIAVRDLERAEARGLPAELLTDSPAHLVASPDVDVVVETMGGDEPARTLIAAALRAGRPVVTANKHVLACHGAELEGIARRTGAPLRFEAAVGGGIPVLGPLAADLAADSIDRVRGIVNGTTNHILSAMAESGSSFEEALADAQALGYAEADPSGDVEGLDAVNKLVILARLAFGAWLDPAAVVHAPPTVRGYGRPGIGGVRRAEVEGAAALGVTLRLLASAARQTADAPIVASVVPTAVAADSPLGRTGGVTNRIEVEGSPVGSVAFSGPGAGGDATSSAVLGDLVALARGLSSTWAGLPPAPPGPPATASPFDEARRWFTVTLVRGPVPPPDALGGPDGRAVAIGEGMAIRTGRLALAEARAAVAALLAPDVDATLYPIDD